LIITKDYRGDLAVVAENRPLPQNELLPRNKSLFRNAAQAFRDELMNKRSRRLGEFFGE
jgi:hypothetical protein